MPRSIFIARITPRKVQVNGPDDVFGTHTVIYCFLGGEHAKTALDELKDWLRLHNVAVMAVVFLILGADLIAKGIPPLIS